MHAANHISNRINYSRSSFESTAVRKDAAAEAGPDVRKDADAKFGAGASDAFRQAVEVLRGSTDTRHKDAAGGLEATIRSGDLPSMKASAKALEAFLSDGSVNPEQAKGLFGAVAALKSKIGALEASGQGGDTFADSPATKSSSSKVSPSASASTSKATSAVSTAVGPDVRKDADAKFGAGAHVEFKKAVDALNGSGDQIQNDVAKVLETAVQKADSESMKAAAQSLEGLLKDGRVTREVGEQLISSLGLLKSKIASTATSGS
jgi:hypothetical protein